MSLYNMIHGVNPLAGVLMKMLDIEPGDVPRFRDCYFNGEHIVIYTRTGGGNREAYEAENNAMCELPGYVRDEDDDYDSTYANFYYEVPEQFHLLIDKLKSMAQKQTQAERWEAALEHIKTASPNDPVVQRMTEAFKPVFEAIEQKLGEQP